MPPQPAWLPRLGTIIAKLQAIEIDYLDRHTVERIFGVRQRRARQLMTGLPTLKVGNAVAVARSALIQGLEGVLLSSSKSSRQRNTSHGVDLSVPAEQKVPHGIRLYGRDLHIRFTTAEDLGTKLSAVSQGLATDWCQGAATVNVSGV